MLTFFGGLIALLGILGVFYCSPLFISALPRAFNQHRLNLLRDETLRTSTQLMVLFAFLVVAGLRIAGLGGDKNSWAFSACTMLFVVMLLTRKREIMPLAIQSVLLSKTTAKQQLEKLKQTKLESQPKGKVYITQAETDNQFSLSSEQDHGDRIAESERLSVHDVVLSSKLIDKRLPANVKKNISSKTVLCFNEYRTMDETAALYLSQHPGPILLDGIQEVSRSIAKLLSGHKGPWLSLSGIKQISHDSLEGLKAYKGFVFFDGLTALSATKAEILSEYKHGVALCGLTELSEQAVKHLSRCDGAILLNGLKELTDSHAEFLSKHIGGGMSLNGIVDLSVTTASWLHQYNGILTLDGLMVLDSRTCVELAKHKGEALSLDGLTELADGVAEALGNHQGSLFLNGLNYLSPEDASGLAKHKGDLALGGLVEITAAVAELLSTHDGRLFLNSIKEPSESVAVWLAKHKSIDLGSSVARFSQQVLDILRLEQGMGAAEREFDSWLDSGIIKSARLIPLELFAEKAGLTQREVDDLEVASQATRKDHGWSKPFRRIVGGVFDSLGFCANPEFLQAVVRYEDAGEPCYSYRVFRVDPSFLLLGNEISDLTDKNGQWFIRLYDKETETQPYTQLCEMLGTKEIERSYWVLRHTDPSVMPSPDVQPYSSAQASWAKWAGDI